MNLKNIYRPRSPWRSTLRTYLSLSPILVLLLNCNRHSDTTVIKLAHGLDQNHPVHKAIAFMAGRVRENSGGKMRIDIYPSQQLGTERECIEMLQIGSLGMVKVSSSVLEGFIPEFNVFSLPYLFRDDQHRFRVLEGNIGRALLQLGEKYWLKGLCFYDAGSRSFYSKERPIITPDDLKGLKIRTQESPTSLRMIEALGGSATPIAWGELYTALQQGIVDGAENNPPSFYLSHHYEVCRYYVLDEHTAVPDVLLISTHVWNRLSAAQKAILQAAVDESVQKQKEYWKASTEEALMAVKEAGVEVIYPDKQPFRDRVSEFYDSYKDQTEFYQLIQSIKAVP